MAEIKNRFTQPHIELGKVVPLAQPFVIILDPSNLCNLRCKFCPSGNHELIKSTGRTQCFFDFELFKKVIADLKEWNEPLKVLRLYKEGEPLLNPRFSDMVRYAKQSGLVKRVDTTTNGVSLRPELNRAIVDAGLDQIDISVNGLTDEQIEGFSGVQVNFAEYVKNIKDLYEYKSAQGSKSGLIMYVKAVKENLTDGEQERFLQIFSPIADRVFFESISPVWPEFEMAEINQKEFKRAHYGQEIVEKSICAHIFYTMVIASDGTAVFCLGDWKHSTAAGNVRTQSLKEIWQGEILNRARYYNVMGKRSEMDFCKHCEVLKYATVENLDPYQSEILSRMQVDAAYSALIESRRNSGGGYSPLILFFAYYLMLIAILRTGGALWQR